MAAVKVILTCYEMPCLMAQTKIMIPIAFQVYCSKFSICHNTYDSTSNTFLQFSLSLHLDQIAKVSNLYKLSEAMETPFTFKIITYSSRVGGVSAVC